MAVIESADSVARKMKNRASRPKTSIALTKKAQGGILKSGHRWPAVLKVAALQGVEN
jgi:hypothetical protein